MKMRKVTVGGFALMVAFAAIAADVGGVKLDDKANVGGQELVLNGAGIRTRAVFKVYVGSLYLPVKTANLEGVLAKGMPNWGKMLKPEQVKAVAVYVKSLGGTKPT